MQVELTNKQAAFIQAIIFNIRSKTLKALKQGSDNNINIMKAASKLEKMYFKFE